MAIANATLLYGVGSRVHIHNHPELIATDISADAQDLHELPETLAFAFVSETRMARRRRILQYTIEGHSAIAKQTWRGRINSNDLVRSLSDIVGEVEVKASGKTLDVLPCHHGANSPFPPSLQRISTSNTTRTHQKSQA